MIKDKSFKKFIDNITQNFNNNSRSVLDTQIDIVNIVNDEFDTNLSFPDEALELIAYEFEESLDKSLSLGYINQDQKTLVENLKTDFVNNGFDFAINKMEQSILTMNLSQDELDEYTLYLNTLNYINSQYPHLFSNNENSRGSLSCAFSVFAFGASAVSLTACTGVVTCGVSVVCLIGSATSIVNNC